MDDGRIESILQMLTLGILERNNLKFCGFILQLKGAFWDFNLIEGSNNVLQKFNAETLKYFSEGCKAAEEFMWNFETFAYWWVKQQPSFTINHLRSTRGERGTCLKTKFRIYICAGCWGLMQFCFSAIQSLTVVQMF